MSHDREAARERTDGDKLVFYDRRRKRTDDTDYSKDSLNFYTECMFSLWQIYIPRDEIIFSVGFHKSFLSKCMNLLFNEISFF